MNSTRTRSRAMWEESPLRPLVSALAAIALALSMTPILAALAQVDFAYADKPGVVVAPLVDHGATPAEDKDTNVEPKDYKLEATTGEDDTINVAFTATGLPKHYNGNHVLAYWIGFGIPQVDGDTYAKGFGEADKAPEFADTAYDAKNHTSAFTKGSTEYVTFYCGGLETLANKTFYVSVKHSDNKKTLYKATFEDVKCVYNITVDPAENGTVDVAETATEDDEVTVTATPDKGYVLDTLTVKGTTGNGIVEVEDGTFTMPSYDVAVTATFKAPDTSKLEAAVKAANEDLNGTKVSTDGSDIDPADKWTTQEVRDTFTRVVSTASNTIGMAQTQAAIDEAVTTLEDAQKAFDDAKKPGTKGAVVPVTSVTLDKTTAALTVGETLELKATVEPEDATDADVDWDSSDLSVATVDGAGIVTAVDTGTATITAKAGDKSATCEVTVTAAEPESVVMHRLYNPNSGEHFYTSDDEEYKNLTALGWHDEGTGWNAPKLSGTPVYRLYNPNAGEHHYTMDAQERDSLVGFGWNDEGIGWYSDDAKGVPVYREYNPNEFANNHNYTTDKDEHYKLLELGWIGEGLAWYGVATS